MTRSTDLEVDPRRHEVVVDEELAQDARAVLDAGRQVALEQLVAGEVEGAPPW